MPEDSDRLRELVAEVAAAYFSNSHVGVNDIPGVISQIASSLTTVGGAPAPAEEAAGAQPEQRKLTPAQLRKSITPDALISFEDGKGYKTLRRHLASRNLTPEQYREKWGLPADYPMVAPSYSAARSQLAKNFGLGQLRARTAAAAAAPAPEAAAAPAKPARKRAPAKGRKSSKAASAA